MNEVTVRDVLRPGPPRLGQYYSVLLRCATRVSWPVDLPTEVVFEIFKYLPQPDLARACRVSRYCIICLWTF